MLQQISESANKLLKTLQQEKNFQTDSDLDMDLQTAREKIQQMKKETERKREHGEQELHLDLAWLLGIHI